MLKEASKPSRLRSETGRRRRARPPLRRRLANSYASFILPAITLMILLVLAPTCYAVWTSLTHWNLTQGTPPVFAGLSNYSQLLHEQRFWASMARTLVFCGSSMLFTLALGLGLALLMNRPLPGKSVFRTLLIVPLVVTPVVVGLTWRFLYDPSLGMVNWFLGQFGVGPIAFLGHNVTALPAVIITFIWEYTPFAFLILLAGLESLPPEPFEAAKVDGSSTFNTFWRITLPMMKGQLGVALLFELMFVFSVFDIIYMMTGGGPGRSTETLVMYAYKLGFVTWEMGKAAAAATILLLLVVVLAGVIARFVRVEEE